MVLLVTDATCSLTSFGHWKGWIIFMIVTFGSTTSAGARLWQGRSWAHGVLVLLWAEWSYLLIQVPFSFVG